MTTLSRPCLSATGLSMASGDSGLMAATMSCTDTRVGGSVGGMRSALPPYFMASIDPLLPGSSASNGDPHLERIVVREAPFPLVLQANGSRLDVSECAREQQAARVMQSFSSCLERQSSTCDQARRSMVHLCSLLRGYGLRRPLDFLSKGSRR